MVSPVQPVSPIPFERTFDALYGLEVTERSDGHIRGRVALRDALRQPAGLLHGGVIASMAEALTSLATWLAVQGEGRTAQGLSNHTSFLRPVLDGSLHAVARARHRGRTTWVWEVEFFDDAERLCALSRMTIAVREATEPGAAETGGAGPESREPSGPGAPRRPGGDGADHPR
jgi:uncharacterized protein (TIGR00369 family)